MAAKEEDAILPAVLVFLKSDIELELLLVTARSTLPSPSKSAATILTGIDPVEKATGAAKEDAVNPPEPAVFLNIDIVLAVPTLLVTARSGLPSPSKSAVADVVPAWCRVSVESSPPGPVRASA